MAFKGLIHRGGPPKGSKNALGNSGKPRQYDIDAEAEDLIKYALDPNNLVLRMHGPLRGYAPSTMNQWASEHVKYSEAYAMAKAIIGARREQLYLQNLSPAAFNRYADFYDDDLHRFEEGKLDKESKRKQKEDKIKEQDIQKAISDYHAGKIKQK